MTTTSRPPSPGYSVEIAALGYAIGQLLQQTALFTSPALRDAAIAFLRNAGLDLDAMPEQDRSVFFTHVGRGHAARAEKEEAAR